MKRALLLALLCVYALHVGAQVTDWKITTKYKKSAAKEQLIKRFTHYVTFDTQSSDTTGKTPSTPGQLKLAKELAKELKKYGAKNVTVDAHSFVTADIPATTDKPAPTLAFIAHLDTALEASGRDVKPQVHKNYKGGDIVINAAQKLMINPQNSPQLAQASGHDIITASGGTLLGADDKTGVAIIMTLVQYLYDHPEMAHGPVKIAFTPDEEIGTGIEQFDVKKFGADYAYTLDGAALGELTNETFNAKAFKAVFTGNRSVHPGDAMNSAFADNILMAADFHTLLPRQNRPETTAGRRGYIYLDTSVTNGDTTTVTGIIRAFTDEEMNQLVGQLNQALRTVKAMYYKGKATLEITDQYRNFKEKLPPQMLTLAQQAMEQEDIKPILHAARGGTDGSTLSFMGLPTPDLFAGQFNIHSEREYADVDVMEASLRTALRLVELYSLQKK
ncbi:MAG: peptidase T [Elusimicrobiaceae bacterium]|nr:peptidase T [Elusimicrobiaceae bacterium]